jgi:hypothetical protein
LAGPSFSSETTEWFMMRLHFTQKSSMSSPSLLARMKNLL